MQQHFITFYSPGTFVPEETTKPIAAWSPKVAMRMAHAITERYAATPYGFQFTTRSRGNDELDSKVTARSPFYWLGGKIETLEEVEARDDPKEEILRSNMRNNDIKKAVINDNSWRFTGPFRDGDVMLDFKPKKRKAAA